MRLVNINQIERGMRLGDPVYGANGQMLLAKGVELTPRYLDRLRQMGMPAAYVVDADTSDVEVPSPITPEARARVLNNLTRAFDQVARSAEAIRQTTGALLREEISSERFAGAIANTGAGEALGAVGQDVESLIGQISGREVLTGLNSIKTHDRYTFMHSLDVTIMGLVLAQRAGWEKVRLRSFGIGCLLHDVGKILIEPKLLNKPAALTPDEFETLKAHTTMGYEIIKAIAPRLGPLVAQVAYQHHERQDGSGYPRRLEGNERLGINEAGRIHDFGALCAVADIYDAMTSHRPYRAAKPADETVRVIEQSAGRHLNAQAVQIFQSVVAPYPMCSAISIRNGRYAGWKGVVTGVLPEELGRPTVRLLFDEKGERTSAIEVDLAKERDVELECLREGDAAAESNGAHAPPPAAPRRTYAIPKAVLAALRESA